MGLGGRVHVVGFQQNVPEYLRLGSVFAFPSNLESFGLALVQALCTGLPAVVRRNDYPRVITSNDSIVEDGVNGFLVDSEEAMARKIAKMLESTRLRDRLSQQAVQRAKSAFKWSSHFDAIEVGLRQIVAQREAGVRAR
jgi:poly(glycerol-phosphate) alpha-glucosyltransferase